MNKPDAGYVKLLMGLALGALSVTVLVACGGGGTDSGGSTSATTGSISGTVTKGPVGGATVRAFAVNNGVKGEPLGNTQTDPGGHFTVRVDAYSGPLMLQVHGGSYMDEATGSRMNLLDTDDMTCVVPSVNITADSKVAGIQVTPLTSMAQHWAERMDGGMTSTNITTANMRIGSAYLGSGMDIVMTQPIDPTVAGSANGASIDAKHYGMILAAMSQEARQLGMTRSSSALVTVLHNDAEDGVMDGMRSGAPINMNGMGGMMGGGNMMPAAGSGELANAMAMFINGPMNRSGVTSVAEMQALMDQLHQLHNTGGHL
jgi:hypothetical protein